MSQEDFERGKAKGAALGYRIINNTKFWIVGFGLLGYLAGISSCGVCP